MICKPLIPEPSPASEPNLGKLRLKLLCKPSFTPSGGVGQAWRYMAYCSTKQCKRRECLHCGGCQEALGQLACAHTVETSRSCFPHSLMELMALCHHRQSQRFVRWLQHWPNEHTILMMVAEVPIPGHAVGIRGRTWNARLVQMGPSTSQHQQ